MFSAMFLKYIHTLQNKINMVHQRCFEMQVINMLAQTETKSSMPKVHVQQSTQPLKSYVMGSTLENDSLYKTQKKCLEEEIKSSLKR